MAMDAKQQVLKNIDYQSYYGSHVKRMGKPSGKGEAMALCCFHDEKNPSMSINVKTGLWNCHACKDGGDVFAFQMKRSGCDFPAAVSELAKIAGVNGGNGNGKRKKKLGTEICRYDYTDETGELLFQSVRYDDPKTFKQGHYENGRWVWGIGEIQRVLYRLPEVVKADEVYVFEGEKDAVLAAEMGFPGATTNPMGAGNWLPEHSESLRDKKVVIVPDRDEPGQKHAKDVAEQLTGIAAEVKIVDLTDLGPILPKNGKDFTDWVELIEDRDKAKEMFQALIDDAKPAADERFKDFPPLTPEQTTIKVTEEPARPTALIETFDGIVVLVKGIVAGLMAAGGVGKTFLLQMLAYALAKGTDMGPLVSSNLDGINILMLCGEDPQEEVNRRMWTISDETGNFPSKLHMVSTVGHLGPFMELQDGNPTRAKAWYWLRETIKNHEGLDLLIIDPKSRFYGLEENNNDHGTQWIACLEALAQEFNITILFSHHVSKASKGMMNQNMSRGASAIVDGCRWVAGLTELSEDSAKRYGIEDPRGYVVFDVTKSNYAAGLRSQMIFKRTEDGILEYAALETERRTKLMAGLYYAIEDNPMALNKRSFDRNEDKVVEIMERIQEYSPKFKKKEVPDLIEQMIDGHLLEEVKVKGETGRPGKFLKVLPIDVMDANQARI
jgi:hypothetical protein